MKLRTSCAAAAALCLVLAACGSDDDEQSSGATTAEGTVGATTAEQGTVGTTTAEGTTAGSVSVSSDPCGADPALVTAAQEEGDVTLFGGGHTREGAESVAAEFEDLYGIPVTVNRQSSGDMVQQIEASFEADAVDADVVSLADVSTFVRWTEEGIIVDSGADLDVLIDGIADPSRPSFPYAITPLGFAYNSSRLDPAEAPTTWAGVQELVADGMTMVYADPNQSGTGLSFMYLASEAMGEDYFDGFAGGDILTTDSALALNQLVLTGEADLGAPAIESQVLLAQSEGEPLEMIYPEEALPVFTSELAVLDEAPHPNAAKLLAQFHVCDVFQSALAELGGRGSTKGATVPAGLPDLSDFEVVTVDAAALVDQRDTLLAQYDSVTG